MRLISIATGLPDGRVCRYILLDYIIYHLSQCHFIQFIFVTDYKHCHGFLLLVFRHGHHGVPGRQGIK